MAKSNKIKDDELVKKLCAGDDAAFNELVSRYTEKVYNLAMRISRNQEDAEEILQDVFVTVYKKISHFQGKSAFSSWLYRITANTSFMKLRKRKRHIAVSFEDLTPGTQDSWATQEKGASDVNYMSSRHELREALEQAICRLPEEYKVIFVLRDVDGLSNQEVGEILDLSVPAVKSRLHRSRLMLRKKLQRFHDDYNSEDKIMYGPNYSGESFLQAAA